MEKRLPFNPEAEAGVLGGIIIDPEAIAEVVDFLKAGDFHRDAHRTIYEVILQLYQCREPADFITICDELERRNRLEDVGGASYITSLINEVPTSGNVAYYGRIVERTATARRLIHTAGQIAALAYAQDAQALEKAEQMLSALERRGSRSTFITMRDLMNRYMEELDMLHSHRGALTGVPTGYSDLDRLTGGLQRADLIILAARPGGGKTSLALNLTENAARAGKHVAIVSLEMGNPQLARRFMAASSHIDLQRLRTGWIEDEEWEHVIAAASELSELPICTSDMPVSSVAAIRQQLRILQREHGEIDLLIVDYLQLLTADEAAGDKNRVVELGRISRGLKLLALEANIPILALAQLSRAVETRQSKIPQLSDLRESGSIENDADLVMFIYREEMYHPDTERKNIADIIVAKHRNGPVGDIQLYWQPHLTAFRPLEASALEEPR